ncbi:MAG: hypothetical protein O7H41_15295 [Planctomycetota bacterium]|nr:hypothetical protein [Planctomycetota bacterium]
MDEAYLSFEGTLRELQIEEDELYDLIAKQTLNPAVKTDGLHFLRSEVIEVKEDREAGETIVMPRKKTDRNPAAPDPDE